MPITRQSKEEQVAELADRFGKLEAAVLTDYHGLTVRQLQGLRATLREQGMDFQVAKNSLFNRAAKQAGLKIEELAGPTGVAFGYEDAVQTAKAIKTFAKDNEALEITGGIVDGELVDAAMIKKLAALPGREELLGRLIGSIGGPTRNLASALSAISRNLVYALTAVKESKA